MGFDIFETETFVKRFDSLDADEKEWVRKIVGQINQNPDKVGTPLKFPWFREKKFRDKRLYYLVYADLKKVLVVAFGDKKEQRKIIEVVLRNLDSYKKLAERL